MLVTCRNCKAKIDQEDAIRKPYGKSGRKYIYFCCDECMKKKTEKKRTSNPHRWDEYQNDSPLYEVIRDIVGRAKDSQICDSVGKLPPDCTEEILLRYLKVNSPRLKRILKQKTFNSQVHRIRYFFAIVNSEVQSFIIDDQLKKKEQASNKSVAPDVTDDDQYPSQYPHKGRGGGLAYWIPWAMEEYKRECEEKGGTD